VLRNSTRFNPPFKADPPPVRLSHPLPIATADATAGPCHALTSWWLAVESRDYRTAIHLTRELRRRWRIVVHVAEPPKGGPSR
jgi:hypothetical protein